MHRFLAIIGVLAATSAVLPARVQASQFTVVAQVSPATVPNGGTATLTGHTRIGADCVVSILYDDGSAAPGLPGQHVGQSGIVQWKWVVHTSASGGTAASACTSKGATAIGQARFSVGAGAASPPPVTLKGKVILVWTSKHAGGKPDDLLVPHSSVFILRGAFDVTVTAQPLDPTKIANAGTFGVEAQVTDKLEMTDAAIFGVGDKAQTLHSHFDRVDCKAGCTAYAVSPVNLRWTVTITQ